MEELAAASDAARGIRGGLGRVPAGRCGTAGVVGTLRGALREAKPWYRCCAQGAAVTGVVWQYVDPVYVSLVPLLAKGRP